MNLRKLFLCRILFFVMFVCYSVDSFSQQDPQFTHYMYNTMYVNPAYAGSRDHPTITALSRTQWVGFGGAPDTQTLSADMSLGETENLGIGFNLLNDVIGPITERYFDVDGAYAIETGQEGRLSFGLKLGGRVLNANWTKANMVSKTDRVYKQDIVGRFLPTIGAGVYYYTRNWYLGLSVPNFFPQSHYALDKSSSNTDKLVGVAVEEMHFFAIAGYVYSLSRGVKLKPATLLKAVSGSPVIVDLSLNALFHQRFTAGLAWRWGDSFSGLLGFQVSKSLNIGYSYDLTSSNYKITNSGTHEVFLRYQIIKDIPALKSPRFF